MRTHILWDNGNGTAAVWRLGPSGDEPSGGEPSGGEPSGGAVRRQFGPFAGWAARALAVGPDGLAHLLWAGPGGAASLWSVDMEAGESSHWEFGPFGGWEARAVAVGPDDVLRVLWAGGDGMAALWSLREGEAPESLDCGPYQGWAARSLAVGPDNGALLLWTRDDGAASVWRVGADGVARPSEFGPYPGWGAVAVAAGLPNNRLGQIGTIDAGGAGRLLWRSAGGWASLWDIPAARGADDHTQDEHTQDEHTQAVHGPFEGWTPAAVAPGAAGSAQVLWRHDGGGLASVWRMGGTGEVAHTEYGPYAGWVPVALAVGP